MGCLIKNYILELISKMMKKIKNDQNETKEESSLRNKLVNDEKYKNNRTKMEEELFNFRTPERLPPLINHAPRKKKKKMYISTRVKDRRCEIDNQSLKFGSSEAALAALDKQLEELEKEVMKKVMKKFMEFRKNSTH
ncbi:Hypothetical protein SRAE_X000032800 [Strongyloides ratti]|uniref:Uncharacterized protein n=1 Tax=Strongyloides ratti TaxID=34506 RepID=A0A090LMB8_STRRB|nr:Hypothetical protein SRAE_X000032800 [Strongyloides ratti]CEF71000.1 Hypothetical protein SRAE_X000032800 [Strongyloides ratti]